MSVRTCAGSPHVVEDDRYRRTGQMLVVQLAEPSHLLLRGGPSPGFRPLSTGGDPVPEQQLLAGRAQAVQQMQQCVTGRQRVLTGDVGAQIHHAGAPELVLQFVCRPYGEGGAAGTGLAVQHDDGRLRLRRGAGRVNPPGDLRQLGPATRERPVGGGQMAEGLAEQRPGARRRTAVPAAQLRHDGGGLLLRRTGRRGQDPLLVQERAYAPHLQRRQPLQPQLLGPAGLTQRTRLPVGGGPVRGGHLGDGGRGARDGDDGACAEQPSPAAVPSATSAQNAAAAATPVTSRGVPIAVLLNRCDRGCCPASIASSAWTYAAYSSPASATRESRAARPRAISVAASVRPPDRRTSSSTARTNSRSASARWLSRMFVPLRELRFGTSVLCGAAERERARGPAVTVGGASHGPGPWRAAAASPGAQGWGYVQSTRAGHLPVSPSARGQSRRLVAVVARGVRGGAQPERAGAAERRLCELSLVPCHGARVFRGRGGRRVSERALRPGEGRPRGAARRRRRVHGGRAGRDRSGRLADDRLPDRRRRALLLRYVLPARAPPRHAVLPPGARRCRLRLDRPPRRGQRGRRAHRPRTGRPLAGARRGGAAGRVGAGAGAARAEP